MSRVALLTFVLFVTACSGRQLRGDDLLRIDATTAEGAALGAWFEGDEAAAYQTALAAADTATARFVRSEVAYHAGDTERAFEDWLALLEQHPGHALTRLAVARLYAARDEVVDFEARVAPVFTRIDHGELLPLTRAYVSQLQQTVDYRLWAASDSAEPFDAGKYGFANRWLVTPLISPWRLTDFDRAFDPETQAQLGPDYLSPYTAVPSPLNREGVQPYWAGGITLYPGFGRTGIYYLETIATLTGDEARDYFVYANFVGAARVWIDGQLVFDRSETNYETGKRYRRIRLEPGTHRILVKMGYQSGYRDWFDLNFVPDGYLATDQSGLSFTYACMADRKLPGCHEGPVDQAGVRLLSEEHLPSALEPVFARGEAVRDASDVALWATMVAAYFDGEHEFFDAAWDALSARRPEFAAGWAMWADEVQTLWQVPSKLRDAWALQAMRKAFELDPQSTYHQTRLGRRLTSKGEEREARDLLARARDGAYDGERLRAYTPLSTWAAYLDSKDWDVEAEKAWRAVLDAEPSNCHAASKLQGILYGRQDYKRPAEITPRAAECPDLEEAWLALDDTDIAARLRYAKRAAGRAPLRGDYAQNVVKLLHQSGADADAADYLRAARERIPDSPALAAELVDRAFAAGDSDEALRLLGEFETAEGTRAWSVWKRTAIEGRFPLADLMPDGHLAAMKAVEQGKDRALSSDEAYFVVDFAARRYFPDGAKVTLTHTVVRVMTKGAIDRYGEQNLPGGAQPLLVRTIKQDGSVLLPEQTAGKSTLSMPGLAEGDFVEIAYVEYDRPNFPPSALEGVRFFFRMADISTLHSEFVVIGEVAEFLRENDAPKIESFDYRGLPAVRFLAKDNPRPRAEPRATAVEEYLPWVQMYRDGHTIDELERFRRDVREAVADSTKRSAAFDDAMAAWTQGEIGEVGSRAWVKAVFYAVAPLVPEPSISARSFNTDVNHIVLLKDGNTMLVLKAVLDAYGVPNDIFAVKSAYQVPREYPIREDAKYGDVLLRVTTTDGGDVWLSPDGPDAMFNAVSAPIVGQPALCVTCADPQRTAVPTKGLRTSSQHIAAAAKLTADGNLAGRLTFTFDGPTAASIRAGLRMRTDETSRSKFVDALAAGVFTGAAATAYDIQGEATPDEALRVVVDFRRESYAREVSPGDLRIETNVFTDAIASAFGGLPERETPMLVGFALDNRYELDIELDGFSGAELLGQRGERRFDSPFGSARRNVEVDPQRLRIEASTSLPIQRVSPADYAAFTQWGLSVEQSSGLRVKLTRK